MASYLLNADDDLMAAWKAAAKLRRIPFSEWLRQAANGYLLVPPSAPAPQPPNVVPARPVIAEPLQRGVRR